MTPKPTVKHGKPRWTIDDRGKGGSGKRLFAPTKDAVLAKLRTNLSGIDKIEITDQDRLAKQELGNRGTLLEAVRYFLARQPAKRKRTVTEAGEKWIAELRLSRVSKGYIANAEHYLKHFRTFAGKDCIVSDIVADHVKGFLASNGTWSAGTRNNIRNRLSTFFYFCQTDGCCTVHPIANRQVRIIKDHRGPPAIFSVAEAQQLLETARAEVPAMIPYLVLGLFCGIRPHSTGEMGKLTAKDINLDEGYVSVPASKSQRRNVDLSDNARAWLRIAPSLNIVTARRQRRNLCLAAGIKWSADVMRHSFASYHIKHYSQPGKTAEMMGHEQSLKMLYRHYVANVTKEDAAAFWSLLPTPIVKVMEVA